MGKKRNRNQDLFDSVMEFVLSSNSAQGSNGVLIANEGPVMFRVRADGERFAEVTDRWGQVLRIEEVKGELKCLQYLPGKWEDLLPD